MEVIGKQSAGNRHSFNLSPGGPRTDIETHKVMINSSEWALPSCQDKEFIGGGWSVASASALAAATPLYCASGWGLGQHESFMIIFGGFNIEFRRAH